MSAAMSFCGRIARRSSSKQDMVAQLGLLRELIVHGGGILEVAEAGFLKVLA